MQNAHIGMDAHNQQMRDPLVLQVAIHLRPLIRNNIPLLVDPNPRMLPIPSLVGLGLARVRPVVGGIHRQGRIRALGVGRRHNLGCCESALTRRRISVKIHGIRRRVDDQATGRANRLDHCIHPLYHSVEALDRPSAPVAVPHVAEQERGLVRRPFLGAGLHLPDSVPALVLCKALGTQVESPKVAHVALTLSRFHPTSNPPRRRGGKCPVVSGNGC